MKKISVDGGHVDFPVEFVDKDKILAVIITKLPEEFELGKRFSIRLNQCDQVSN